MNFRKRFFQSIITCILIASSGYAELQQTDKPEQLPQMNSLPKSDWLLDGSPYKAEVYRGKKNDELVICNGLISRTFKLIPNAATTGFDNLMTGESIIRGVKPEAMIQLDGSWHEIGGLKGQSNFAFLREDWIDKLEASPDAFTFCGYEISQPVERIKWNQVRYHAKDAVWPPRGVHLRMDYKMPELSQISISETMDSNVGRKRLLYDNFSKAGESWKIHTSKSHPRSSFINEGKFGEIYTPANTAVYAERELPEGTKLVEVQIDAGTDSSASWGPGIALVYDNTVIKFYLRPGGNANNNGVAMFGLTVGSNENAAAGDRQKPDLSKPCNLRLMIDDNKIYAQAKPQKGTWTTCEEITIPADAGKLKSVRVGKTSKTGGADDFSEPGNPVRLRIMEFAAYGSIDTNSLSEIRKQNNNEINVSVHYELYDGVPVLSKWITVANRTNKPVQLNNFKSEILAAVEYSSAVEDRGVKFTPPNIHVETEYAFSGMTSANTSRFSVHWQPDPDYRTQVNYPRMNPCMLEVRPELGPDMEIAPGGEFESFHAFIKPNDSFDRERNGLAQRKMYRIISPWITENPLMMHVRYADWDTVKNAIDQCAEVGFEMVILTFGSGFNIENDSDKYIAEMKRYADYAKSKGIEIGGYSLLASRRIGNGNDVVMPEGKRPTFGNSPCLGSKWGQDYFRKLYQFYEKTGFMLLEHDGSYPGDECMATDHPGHKGHGDSRWRQWQVISDFYKWCRSQGVYLNVPDFYYLAGSNKCGMGYRESNWSLPRSQQVIHTRQNIYDGTWQKTPGMGWMFVPLTQYQGGGSAATIEPLNEHLDHYEKMMLSNLGAGVQACYRGPRLYDTDQTKQMVKNTVDWYKQHREVLEGDIIHLRRPDGRDIDYWLNVNPGGKEKGMLMIFNPLKEKAAKSIRVNLYYTGLTDTAKVIDASGTMKTLKLNRDYSIDLDIDVMPESSTWYVFE